MIKTYSPKLSEISNDWYVIDAKDLVLGRLAVVIANRLRGKHKPSFARHMDCGDNIIVINVDKIATTGKKIHKNKFYWHTGYPGGLKEKSWNDILSGKYPDRLLFNAVRSMISKGPLRNAQMRRLYLYQGEEHKHHAQTPKVLDVATMNVKNVK